MDDDAGFLRAVLAAPEDDALRLVYADWLDERGDPRGEYLRCQCARAALRPADPKHAALLRREEELRQQYPAVILPWQRRLTVGRILNLLGRTGGDAGGAEGVSERGSPYTPKPCLTERELTAWEAAYGVPLPEGYRLFLREVGDGGTMPGSYCDFVVRPLAEVRGGPRAATPFPVTAGRLRQRFRQLKAEGRPADGVLFPELGAFWEGADQPPGCLVFGQYPSGDALFLVTAGDLRGSVWCGVCCGIPEMARSGEPVEFLDWFADALAEFEGGA
jgi:uncharacterized protein (TIGR02996 family)